MPSPNANPITGREIVIALQGDQIVHLTRSQVAQLLALTNVPTLRPFATPTAFQGTEMIAANQGQTRISMNATDIATYLAATTPEPTISARFKAYTLNGSERILGTQGSSQCAFSVADMLTITGGAPAPVPAIVTAPSFTGTAQQGQTLTGSRGTYTNSPTSYTNQWQSSPDGTTWTAISGATALNYLLTASEVGKVVRLTEVATNAGGSSPQNNSSASGTVAAASAQLPQQGAMIARWSSDAIPAQADNTDLTAWADSIGPYTATKSSTNAPKYRTSGMGGKPYVQFTPTAATTAQAQVLDAGNVTAINTALQSGNSTILVVLRNPALAGGSALGAAFTASDSTGYNVYHNGAQGGLYGSVKGKLPDAPVANALRAIAYVTGRPDTSNSRTYINGTCLGHAANVKPTSGQSHRIGGTLGNGLFNFKGELYDIIIWNVSLTNAEVIQATKWALDRYSQSYPWASVPFRAWHGDSITMGLNTSGAGATMPYLAAQRLGLTVGQWTNISHAGAAYTGSASGTLFNLADQAGDDVDALVSALGTPIHLFTMEWYNQQNLSTPSARATTYLNARRTAGVSKICFATSTTYNTDQPGSPNANRITYDNYWDTPANRTGLIDAYVALHNDTNVGVPGACPSTGGNTYFSSDGVHPNDAGTAAMEALIGPAMAGM